MFVSGSEGGKDNDEKSSCSEDEGTVWKENKKSEDYLFAFLSLKKDIFSGLFVPLL